MDKKKLKKKSKGKLQEEIAKMKYRRFYEREYGNDPFKETELLEGIKEREMILKEK